MKLNLSLKMPPIDINLDLKVTKNQKKMKKLFFAFLCRILTSFSNSKAEGNIDFRF